MTKLSPAGFNHLPCALKLRLLLRKDADGFALTASPYQLGEKKETCGGKTANLGVVARRPFDDGRNFGLLDDPRPEGVYGYRSGHRCSGGRGRRMCDRSGKR